MHCTDAPSVQPVLKTLLLRPWHALWAIVRCMHRRPLLYRRFNRCWRIFCSPPKMLSGQCSDKCTDTLFLHVVQPESRSFFTWFRLHSHIGPMTGHRCIRWPSDAPTARLRCIRWPSDARMAGRRFNQCSRLCFGISTADWTYHLDDGLDMASRRWIGYVELYRWDVKILQMWSHKLVSPIDYVLTQSPKS